VVVTTTCHTTIQPCISLVSIEGMVGPTLSLLQLAFGVSSTPYTVLGCNVSSTPAELRRAYRAAALLYHPDRASNGEGAGGLPSRTLKFQWVSAAYQVLMDEAVDHTTIGRARFVRTMTATTATVFHPPPPPDCPKRKGMDALHRINHLINDIVHSGGGQDWEFFFRSVFNEMVGAGARHAGSAKAYHGSKLGRLRRKRKGEQKKACVPGNSSILATAERWRRTILEDSSEEEGNDGREDIGDVAFVKATVNDDLILMDTDDDDKEDGDNAKDTATKQGKRHKMGCCVAKKRKAIAEKEADIADILGSRDRSGAGGSTHATAAAIAVAVTHHSRPLKVGGISDALLSNLEAKYGGKDRSMKKKEMKKKRCSK
jgi:hypothetical protein